MINICYPYHEVKLSVANAIFLFVQYFISNENMDLLFWT